MNTTRVMGGDLSRLALLMALAVLSLIRLVPPFICRLASRNPSAWHHQLGAEIAHLSEQCGPAAIKLVQLLSARADLFPPAFLGGLSRVQDQVRIPSRRTICRALEQNYGCLSNAPFALASWVPIAAGSIAIVLEARTQDGRQVAIKIVRPGIESRLRRDLRLITSAFRFFEMLPQGRPFPLSTAVEQLSAIIINQCDMEAEAANANRLSSIVGDDVIIAMPVPSLVRPQALVMPLIRGHYRVTGDVPDDIYQLACKRLLRAIYRMIFEEGVVHCDLHPGNVAIDAAGKPILYDYGLVAHLRIEDRKAFKSLFMSIAARSVRHTADAVIRSAAKVPDGLNRARFEMEVGKIVRRWGGKSAGDFLIAALIRDLFQLQHRHGITNVPGFFSAVCALASFEGLVRARYPELDFQGEAMLFLLAAPPIQSCEERPAIQEKIEKQVRFISSGEK